MSMTGDYLSAEGTLRCGLVTRVVEHEQLMPAARAVAASIVGNNQKSVRALLESHHRIDEGGHGHRTMAGGRGGPQVDACGDRGRHRRQPGVGDGARPGADHLSTTGVDEPTYTGTATRKRSASSQAPPDHVDEDQQRGNGGEHTTQR